MTMSLTETLRRFAFSLYRRCDHMARVVRLDIQDCTDVFVFVADKDMSVVAQRDRRKLSHFLAFCRCHYYGMNHAMASNMSAPVPDSKVVYVSVVVDIDVAVVSAADMVAVDMYACACIEAYLHFLHIAY